MGTINKYSNLYNKDNTVIKLISINGVLTDYSIKELEELVDTLTDGNGKINAMSILQKMYADPKTEADKKYVAELRKELLEKLKTNMSTKKEEVTRALGEVNDTLKNKVEDALEEITKEQEQKDPSFQVICHNPEVVEEFDKAVRDSVKEVSNDDEYVEPISETPITEEDIKCGDGILSLIDDKDLTYKEPLTIESVKDYIDESEEDA